MRILIINSANENSFDKLIHELSKNKNTIECLITHDKYLSYKGKYKSIKFIDINKEEFYDLSQETLNEIKNKRYDTVYVTVPRTFAYNYGNIINILEYIWFKNAFFYNCNNCAIRIPSQNWLFDYVCGWYIDLLNLII